jgi:NADH-quinone oxidoreductase subunit L
MFLERLINNNLELFFIFLPFFGGFFSYLFRRYLGLNGVLIVNVQSLLLSAVFVLGFTIISFYSQNYNNKIIILNFVWFNINNLIIEWTFLFDGISLLMSTLILIITSLVELYSVDYMKEDINKSRFFMLLSFFAFFLLIFVTAGNILQLFIGWEGIGIISFLLINFWFTRLEANRAGLKAVLFNKIGDIGFYILLVLLFFLFHTLDLKVIQETIEYYDNRYIHFFDLTGLPRKIYFGRFQIEMTAAFELPKTWTNVNLIHWLGFFDRDFNINFLEFIGLALLTAAAGKSAQFGLHAWLPDAMEGPTPVSSLLHSATMVTAGVFLLIRFNFLLNYCPKVLILVSIVGGITAFFSGIVALLQMDIKKVVAYSTCSQLGFMVAACGIGAFNIAFFHLYTHAFFKCLLFLTSGSVIHALNQEQDVRKLGGLYNYLPFTAICMIIGYLGLIGMPFFSGFYSKEAILISYLCEERYGNILVFSLLLSTTFITCFYSLRTFYHIFLGKKRGSIYKLKSIHEAPFFMAIPLFFLSLLTILFGFLFQDIFIGLGSNYFFPTLIVKEVFQFFELLHFEEKFLPLLGLVYISIWFIIYYFGLFGKYFCYFYSILIKRYLNYELRPFVVEIVENKESDWFWLVHIYFTLVETKRRMFYLFSFKIYKALSLRWYFGSLYRGLTFGLYELSYDFIIKLIDRGYLEILGAFGIVQIFSNLSTKINLYQNGLIFSYLFLFFCGIVTYIEYGIFFL